MGINIVRYTPVEDSVVPESVEDERQRLLREAQAQVKADFPNAEFAGKPPISNVAPLENAAPAGPRAPQIITIGRGNNQLPEETAPATAEEDTGFFRSAGRGFKAGAHELRKWWEGWLQHDLERQSDEGVDLSKVDSRALANIPLGAQLNMAKSNVPKEKREELIKGHMAAAKAADDEIAGLRPKTKDFWDNAVFNTTSSLTFAAPALAVGIMGKTPNALLVLSSGTYYNSYADHRAKGKDPEAAARLAGVDAIAEGVTEAGPFAKLFGGGSLFKKFIGTLIADIPGEIVANYVQTATANLAALPADATRAQVEQTLRASAGEATRAVPSVMASTAMGAGAQAGAVRGVEALANRVLGEKPAPAPRRAPVISPAQGQPPPTPPSASAAPAAPAEPVEGEAPGAAQVAFFKPPGLAQGAVVTILKMNPESKTANVVRVDPDTGDPVLDSDGNPQAFVANFDDLQFFNSPSAVGIPPKPAATPPSPTPDPAAAPPAVTSAEPTSDIAGQVKDMYRAGTPRRGVYVSPATIQKMQAEGTYDALKKTGVHQENFDGQGGLLIVKSRKDLEEAVALRDSGMADMQEIIGRLTGAGIQKPKGRGVQVVQRKDEKGAVVQQSAVTPEQVPAAVAAQAQLPGTVEVTTPEVVIAERQQRVADEQVPSIEAPVKQKPKQETAYDAADFGVRNALMLLNSTAQTGRKIDVRETAQAVGVAAQMLRQAAQEAGYRGAPAEVVRAATDVAAKSERLTEKGEIDFVKSRGVSEPKLRQRMVEIQGAMKMLEEWRDKPRITASTESVLAAKGQAAKKGKKADKGKETAADKVAAEVLAKPSVAEGVKEDLAKNREQLEAPSKAAEAEARAEMKPEVKAAVENAEKVFAKEQERRKENKGPPEGQKDRRADAPPPKQVGPTGIEVAPPGEKVVHRKKKYVPPKKTEAQVVQEVAEKTAPNAIETIELAPSAVAGDEEQFISELMGATPPELRREAQLDKSGRLSQVLVSLVQAMGDRNSWAGWFAAVTRGGVMSREQRNEMLGMIREYAAAARQDLPAIREKMLGLLTNVDGKMLPQPAIAGVFEAANLVRTYTTLAEQLREMDTDLAEIEADTGQSSFDKESLKTEGPGSMSTARENEIGGVARSTPKFDAIQIIKNLLLINSSKNHPLNSFYFGTAGLMARAGTIQKLMMNSMLVGESQRTDTKEPSGTFPGTHEIMDIILGHAAELDEPAMISLLTKLRASMPNVPVEFVDENRKMIDETGRQYAFEVAGMHTSTGFVQLSMPVVNGRPIFNAHSLRIMLHEFVHAATANELHRDTNSPLNRQIDALRTELIQKARKLFGAAEVNETLAWFENRGRGGVRPVGVDRIGNHIYALSNNREFVAEALTSPDFLAFVSQLDQGDVGFVRKLWNSLVRALAQAFGVKNPAEKRLLNDALLLSLRAMDIQRGRATRMRRQAERVADEIEFLLALPKNVAREVAFKWFSGDTVNTYDVASQTTAPSQIDDADVDIVLRNRQPTESTDFMRIYNKSLEERTKEIRFMRIQGRRIDAGLPVDMDAMPRLRNHQQVAGITSPGLAAAAAGVRRLLTSRFMDGARDRGLGFLTTDFIVRRNARLFGTPDEQANPLNAWKRIRDTRRSHANRLLELAEKTVNSKWMKLTAKESEEIGTVLQQTTLWQIDPEQGKTQPKLLPGLSQKRWEAKVAELNAAWAKLNPDQKDVYRSTQKYFQIEYAQIRRAGMDMAMDLFGGQFNPQQRTLLYALRNADDAEKLITTGGPIDLGPDGNEKFRKVVRDLIRVSAIKGPYFPLMRKGNLVVEAEREGTIAETYPDRAAALVAADQIRSRAPKNTAKVRRTGAHSFVVDYKMRHVSFHDSQADAEAAMAELRAAGLRVVGDVYSRKLESVESASLTEGLKELLSKASQVAEAGGTTQEQQVIRQTLESAFMQILAERAASASQQLKRQGVAGFKGKEAHEIFSRRVRASSWHYANLKTALEQSKALSRLRNFSRDPGAGSMPPRMSAQETILARGRTLHEITDRLRVEAAELDSLDRSNLDFVLGQLGFVNFLASPSYTMVNAMQNFNVALPYMTGRFGMRGGKNLLRGMKVVTGPAFAKAFRGLFSKPGAVTTYDVYQAIAEAVEDHPRFGRFAKGQGGQPSALQQLVDLGVINASFIQELSAVANNQNILVSRGIEWLRLFPQGAELFNRISTGLAALESTNGDVAAAAAVIDQVHFNYALENRPRYFRKIGGMRLPQALTMFKMYGVSMYQLTGSLIVDAVSRRGQSGSERRQAATALAGIIASHTLSAGIIGGIMLEPLRLLMQLWQAMFGDDDEFSDLDTAVQRWATEVTGSEMGGRILSRGAWNALGFDLSSRMGLDRLLVYNPPESFTENEMGKLLLGLLGPIPATMVQKSVRAYELATVYGKPFEAIMELIPAKLVQDARKAWGLVTKGVESRSGETVVGAEEFNWIDAAGRAAGFQTTQEGKAGDQADTAFSYKGWRTGRVRQLTEQFWRAYDSGDAQAQADAVAAIGRFNEKNPGAPLTAQGLRQSRATAARAVRERTGEGRNPDLNKLLDY